MTSVLSDKIIIQCINGEEIPVSANLLLEKTFYLCSLINVNSNGSSILRLEQKSEHVRQLLSFLEREDAQLTSLENCFEIYKLGKMYDIKQLPKICRNYIIHEMEVSNVCRIHDFALYHNDTFIQYYCWKLFDLPYDNILKSEEFFRCSENTLMRFVSRPIYQNLDELKIFDAVCSWAITKNNERKRQSLNIIDNDRTDKEWIRSYMEPFLPLIRFLTMEPEEMYEHVFPKNILNEKEISAIRFYIKNHQYYNYPETLSKCTIKRIPENKHFWYSYHNRSDISLRKEIFFKNSYKFQCDVFLEEECFLTGLSLPISHQNVEGIVTVINILSPVNKRIIEVCKGSGDIYFQYPPFLPKDFIIAIYVKIPEEEITERNRIKILSTTKFHISKKYAKKLKSNSSWKIFTFDAKLYF